MPDDLTRRNLLARAGAATLASLLGGCVKAPPFKASCPAGPQPAPPPTLTIDTHCHIFNGTDLQAAEFLTKVVEQGNGEAKVAAQLLQDLVWSLAPDGDEELRVLKRLVKSGNRTNSKVTLKDHRDKAYLKARKAILNTKAMKGMAATPLTTPPPAPPPPRANAPAARPSEHDVAARIADRLMRAGTLNQYKEQAPTPPPPPPKAVQPGVAQPQPACVAGSGTQSLDGVIDYIIHNFHYRYVLVDDYLNAFTYNTGRCIDLIAASMVDYDWWLKQGQPTKTPLKTQVEVMEQISILSGGMVHGLVPFDPFREVAYLAGKGPDSSLALVQDAVQSRGCIGVKIYPPMGFAPLGNADFPLDFWENLGLPPWISDSIPFKDKSSGTFGQRLDEALKAFYQWCCDEEVPILAHSNMTNGSTPKFDALAGSHYWQIALGAFKTLRISFGHLGDFSQFDKPLQDAPHFVDLMGGPGMPGEHAFADSAYFSSILTQDTCLADRLKTFYSQSPALADRLMYGTDWSLLINEGNIEDYFQNFVQALAEIDKVSPPAKGLTASQRFFGYNAVNWLGLAGGKARTRLDAFYAKNHISNPPPWLSKLTVT